MLNLHLVSPETDTSHGKFSDVRKVEVRRVNSVARVKLINGRIRGKGHIA
jgi:hypothetical protein